MSNMKDLYYSLTQAQHDRYQALFAEGLASANKGNPFWSQRDAMIAFNVLRAAQRTTVTRMLVRIDESTRALQYTLSVLNRGQ